jgi:hypothetical protein
MITKSSRRDSGRITIAATMALIAMAAMMLASTSTRISDPPLNEILTLFIELVLPLYLLVNLERPLSVAKVAAAALATVYLAWGASVIFWPGRSLSEWTVLKAIYKLYWYIGYRLIPQRPPPLPVLALETMRWNWGLLAAFYAAILVITVTRGFGKRVWRVGLGGLPLSVAGSDRISRALQCLRPVALAAALWLLSEWLPCLYQGRLARCGWLYPIGLVGSFVFGVTDRRPHPPSWRLSRFALRAARLVPSGMAGVVMGLAWSLWGWQYSVGTAAVFLVIQFSSSRLAIRRSRRHILVHLLAAFWGFALSAEIGKGSFPMTRT